MTDRELLELAAKAAGYVFKWEDPFGDIGEDEPTIYDDVGFGQYWDPLVDDGDAFRLAVKLHLRIDLGNYESRVFKQWDDTALSLVYFKDKDGYEDECLATRKAIVEAAAELAKKEMA